MSAPASSEWLTAPEIAKLNLPGLPTDERRMRDWAKAEGWAERTAANGMPLARRRAARGGGTEYHVSLLPRPAQVVRNIRCDLEARVAAKRTAALIWADYEIQPSNIKAEAERRLAILTEVRTLAGAGAKIGSAAKAAARTHGVSVNTINSWRRQIRGVEFADWLPLLMPRRTQIDPDPQCAMKTLCEALLRLDHSDRRRILLDLLAGELAL